MQFFGGKVDLEKKLRPSSNIQPIVSSSLHYHSEDVKYVKSGHPLSALKRHCQQYISASSEHNISVAYIEFEKNQFLMKKLKTYYQDTTKREKKHWGQFFILSIPDLQQNSQDKHNGTSHKDILIDQKKTSSDTDSSMHQEKF